MKIHSLDLIIQSIYFVPIRFLMLLGNMIKIQEKVAF